MMVAPVANAATKVSLNKHTTKAGYTTTWYPSSSPNGRKLTEGGTQKMQFYFSERGNKIAIGFQKTSNSAKYSWYSGTLSGSSKYASKTLVGSTAYYKPYLTNNNATVSITTLGSSYYFYE